MSVPPDLPEARQLITIRDASDDTDSELEGYGCLEPVTILRGKSRSIDRIPCLRSSALNAIYSGVGVGLGTYALRGNIHQANLLAVGAFSVVLCTNWFLCRAKLVNDKHAVSNIEARISEYIKKRNKVLQEEANES